MRSSLKTAVAASLVILTGCAAAKALAVFRQEAAAFHPPHTIVTLPTGTPDLDGLKAVSFQSLERITLHGWILPSRNSAAVILAHGAEADRRQLLPEH